MKVREKSLQSNKKMRNAIEAMQICHRGLDAKLSNLAATEFKLVNDCVLLDRLTPNHTNVTLSDFEDRTGYEAFMNSVSVDGECSRYPLEDALRFAFTVLSNWNNAPVEGVLVCLLSNDGDACVLKFHLWRQNECLIGSDLEAFEEGILVAPSDAIGELSRVIAVQGTLDRSKN